MKHRMTWLWLATIGVAWGGPPDPGVSRLAPPSIRDQLKPAIYERVTRERDVAVHADLEDLPGEKERKHYSLYAAMMVRASLSRSRQVLTDYRIYRDIIPYVEEASFDAARQRLRLRGGIWKYRLDSTLQFIDRGERWIEFRVVEGHFTGFAGSFLFEPQGERGTLVHLRGALTGGGWPPALVVERGAEIVFGFTARRMRSYIEDFHDEKAKSSQEGKTPHDPGIPEPQTHLQPRG